MNHFYISQNEDGKYCVGCKIKALNGKEDIHAVIIDNLPEKIAGEKCLKYEEEYGDIIEECIRKDDWSKFPLIHANAFRMGS